MTETQYISELLPASPGLRITYGSVCDAVWRDFVLLGIRVKETGVMRGMAGVTDGQAALLFAAMEAERD